MGNIKGRKSLEHEEGKVVLHLEGMECICPTDPTGDNVLLLFVLGFSLCAIGGGVVGTFVPKALGFDAYEPLCTASAATILTIGFTMIWDANGLLEAEAEDFKPIEQIKGLTVRGVMLSDLFHKMQDQGQVVAKEWNSSSADQVIFKINEEVILGKGTNLFRSLEMKNGDFIKIDRDFYPEDNAFRFELEEWDFSSNNNKLIPAPAGIYKVSALEGSLDFTKESKTPGLYFVSTANKSIYVLYGRLEVRA